jgi:hypothetical protein
MAVLTRLPRPRGRPVQTTHSHNQKTCTQHINCCAKKYRPKWALCGAYSMNNRKRQQ